MCLIATWLPGQRFTMRQFDTAEGFPTIEMNTPIVHPDGSLFVFGAGKMSIFDGVHVQIVKMDSIGIFTYPERVFITKNEDLLLAPIKGKPWLWELQNKSFQPILCDFNYSSLKYSFEYKNEIYLVYDDFRFARFSEENHEFIPASIPFLDNYLESWRSSTINLVSDGNDSLFVIVTRIGGKLEIHIVTDSIQFKLADCDFQNSFLFDGYLYHYNTSDKNFSFRKGDDINFIDIEGLDLTKYKLLLNIFQNDRVLLGFSNQSMDQDLHWYILSKDRTIQKLGYMPGNEKNQTVIDQPGNFWSASHMGLDRCIPQIQFFPSSEQNVPSSLHAIGEQNGTIYLAGYHSDLSIYDGKKVYIEHTQAKSFLPGSLTLEGTGLLLILEAEDGLLRINEKGKKILPFYIDGERITVGAYYLKQLSNGKTGIGLQKYGFGIISEFNEDKVMIDHFGVEKGILLDNVLTFTEDERNRIWMGRSSKGIAVYDPDVDTAFTYLLDPEDSGSFGAMSSDTDHKGNIWFGANDGLYFFEHPSDFELNAGNFFDEVQKINLPDGDETIITFLKQIGHFIIFGNTSAVSFLPLEKWYNDRDHCPVYQLYYGEDIEGNGSEQNMILEDSKGYLWWGSQTGASRMDLANFVFDTTRNKIEVRQVTNGKKALFLEKGDILRLPVDNRNFSLSFGLESNPSLLRNVFFTYYLTNEKGDTLIQQKYDRQGSIEVTYLVPGKYQLEIVASKYGLEMDRLLINVRAPFAFFESPYTLAGISIVFFGGLAFFLWYRGFKNKQVYNKDLHLSRIEQEKNQLHMQSIISSFNPHFINNSLHWAQSRYRNDDEMVRMIGRLSENIRYIFILTKSGKGFHALAKELTLVENYVMIQQIRFNHSFKLKLPDVELLERLAKFTIPIMQLQIHVENAIEHGLRNRLESSFVELNIREESDEIVFSITDDGCGRKEANKVGSQGTQTGTRMLEELHQLFNENVRNKIKIRSWYEDDLFLDAKGIRFGTRINISIPQEFTYET